MKRHHFEHLLDRLTVLISDTPAFSTAVAHGWSCAQTCSTPSSLLQSLRALLPLMAFCPRFSCELLILWQLRTGFSALEHHDTNFFRFIVQSVNVSILIKQDAIQVLGPSVMSAGLGRKRQRSVGDLHIFLAVECMFNFLQENACAK